MSFSENECLFLLRYINIIRENLDKFKVELDIVTLSCQQKKLPDVDQLIRLNKLIMDQYYALVRYFTRQNWNNQIKLDPDKSDLTYSQLRRCLFRLIRHRRRTYREFRPITLFLRFNCK